MKRVAAQIADHEPRIVEILVTTQRVEGYGLTTANILYRRPDHPWLLQSYVLQNYDLLPDFPELQCFQEFWQKSLTDRLDLHGVLDLREHPRTD
jgi:uncharacterized protein Usg